nr:hypothetical protein [Tanacetum cinerariifolium]
VKSVNKDVRLQALVDGKKVIVNETSIRHNLRLDDAEGTACLSNVAIFKELARIRVGIGISRAITPLFATMMVQAPEEVGEIPTDTQVTPIITQPSSSQPQRKHKSRRKETEIFQDETPTEEHIPIPFHDPLPTEIKKLKKRVKKLEGKKKKRTHRLKRLYKSEKVAKKEVITADLVTTASESTLAQTLIEIKAAKPKALTTVATIITVVSTRPKEKGIIMQEPSETPSSKPIVSSLQQLLLSQTEDKGKAKMVKPKRPLKKKDQIALDEEVARMLEAQMKAEIEKEGRIAKEKYKANIAVIEEWDDV